MSPLAATMILAWFAILLLALAMSGLLRQITLLRATLERGAVGSENFLVGSRLPEYLRQNSEPRPTIFVFLEGSCSSCIGLVATINEYASIWSQGVRFAAIVSETDPSLMNLSSEVEILVHPEAQKDLHVQLVPFAIMCGEDGVIVSAEPVGSTDRFDLWFRAATVKVKGGAKYDSAV